MSNRRMERLLAGGGRLSEQDAKQLAITGKNARAIQQLTKRGENKGLQTFKTNRAIRTWLLHGKEKKQSHFLPSGEFVRVPREKTSPDSLRAIRALRLLGVDIEAGIFYIKGVTA